MGAEPRVVVDYRGAPVTRTRWRTFAVFAHTMSCSGRIVGRATVGRLTAASSECIAKRWCEHCFRLSMCTLTVAGDEALDPRRAYLLVSNHSSLLDIPAVVLTFPGRVRFVAKQELSRVPIFGSAMKDMGIVFVDRRDRARAVEQLGGAKSLVADGTSVWIAAEGGRSRDGSLGPFKRGPFHLALALGVPIVPTWVEGANAVIAATSLASVTGQRVDVRYGAPIATAGLSAADIDPLSARVRAELERLREGVGG